MKGLTIGDSSIHRCYHSDNFYRYLGYPIVYTTKTNEIWKVDSGTWNVGNATIPQLGYIYTTMESAQLVAKTSYSDVGILTRTKTVSPTARTSTVVLREATSGTFPNRYYVRQYATLVNNHSVELIKYYNSAEIIVAYSTDSSFLDKGKMKEITATTIGDKIRVWINDKPVLWNTGGYEAIDSQITSGYFGLRNDGFGVETKETRFYNAFLFDIAPANKGMLWDDFYLMDYTETGGTKTNYIRIPGKIGSHIQASSPDSKQYTISGRITKSGFDAKSFDELMLRLRANQLPVFVHTPAFKASGIVTNYSPPKPKKGTADAYHDFEFTLLEDYFYEV